jgi:alkylhydroperoxidase family enzyme
MLGQSVGLSREEIAAMAAPAELETFDATDRLVLRYSEGLTRDNRVDDAMYAELSERFSKDELVELCLTIGLAAMVNRFHATFLTDLDEATDEAVGDVAFCPIGR